MLILYPNLHQNYFHLLCIYILPNKLKTHLYNQLIICSIHLLYFVKNKNFRISSLHCFFTNLTSCSLVLPSLIEKQNTGGGAGAVCRHYVINMASIYTYRCELYYKLSINIARVSLYF